MNDKYKLELNKNIGYFNFIKNRVENNKLVYPHLQDFLIEKEYLIYNNCKASLYNIPLYELDNELFKLDAKLFFFTVNTLSNLINNYDHVCKKINYAEYLVQQNNLTTEHFDYLKNFDLEYSLLLLSNNTFYNTLLIELTTTINYVYELAYDETLINTQGAQYLKKLELDRNKIEFSTGSPKSIQRLRTGPSNHFKDSNSNNDIDFLSQTAAFMNATFIISITLMLGIAIAIIFFAIAVS